MTAKRTVVAVVVSCRLRWPCGGGGALVLSTGGVMRRLVTAALIAALVTTATVGAGAAQDRPEGGLNPGHGIAEARSHTAGPVAAGITFEEILVTGQPRPGGATESSSVSPTRSTAV